MQVWMHYPRQLAVAEDDWRVLVEEAALAQV
jgi:hypothetical protein